MELTATMIIFDEHVNLWNKHDLVHDYVKLGESSEILPMAHSKGVLGCVNAH